MTPLHILQTKFGYSGFRLEQEAIITSVLQKRDTFVLMPTGGGKSVCYQVPALLMEGLTLVISPLIALMKDQVDALRVNGIEAAYLNSTQSSQEHDYILGRIRSGALKLLYLAPERLLKSDSSFFKTITSFPISLIAIDEAHCISHWGHDFRPEYLMLAQLKRALPAVPIIALTATADRLTRKDIVEKLELINPATFVSSFNRANIRYTVDSKQNSFQKLIAFLNTRREESGIIYCLSRAATESLATRLSDAGFAALPYHAGLERDVRTKHQDMFLKDEVKIVVATIAFGMGIDKSNVRYVVHMDLPKNIESYYQETGRAGRDGVDSEALLFFSVSDVIKLKRFVTIDDNPEQTEIYLRKLDQMNAYGNLYSCRRKYLLNYFDEAAADYCGNCDVCLTRLEMFDGTTVAQKVLSAVTRLEERYGAVYVIDFLRGSRSEKISEEHKKLKTFGAGADISKVAWRGFIEELIQQGYLSKTADGYPKLTLTDRSGVVLRGETKVMLTKAREHVDAELNESAPRYDSELLQKLKQVRRELAQSEGVAAYIVLSDASLIELATYLPHNKEEFRRISGFGEIKIEKYGKYFWEVIADYCGKHSLGSRIHLKASKQRVVRQESMSETKKQTLELFRLGHSVARIAELRSLAVSTIETHLAFFVGQGMLSITQLMSMDKAENIMGLIDMNEEASLSAIKDQLGGEYSYGEIRFAMAYRGYRLKGSQAHMR